MGWSDRPDDAGVCRGVLGAVANSETVARLFVAQVPYQGYQWFVRRDLLPSPNGLPESNVCGESDGLSVDRATGLSDEDLVARSTAHAERQNASRRERGKPANQLAGGARIASVATLRAVRRQGGMGEQVIFVYDDPKSDNAEHAVVRMLETVPEEEVAGLADDVKACFERMVSAG